MHSQVSVRVVFKLIQVQLRDLSAVHCGKDKDQGKGEENKTRKSEPETS